MLQAAAVNAKEEEDDETGMSAEDIKRMRGVAFTAAQPAKGKGASGSARGGKGGGRGGGSGARGGAGGRGRGSAKARK